MEELDETTKNVTKHIENYKFGIASELIYNFVWHQFADGYIESSKDRREEAQPILEYILKTSLQLLHPYMPFITEDLWQRLKETGSIEGKKDLIVSSWPKAS